MCRGALGIGVTIKYNSLMKNKIPLLTTLSCNYFSKNNLLNRLLILLIFSHLIISQSSFASASNETNASYFNSRIDITGKYELKNNKKETIAAFKITGSATTIFVEIDSNSDADLITDEKELYKEIKNALSGEFTWIAAYGAFRRAYTTSTGSTDYVQIIGGNPSFLGIRKNAYSSSGSIHWGNLYRVQGSLSDLVNTSRSDVSAYSGKWTIEGTSTNIQISAGVDYDMLVRYGTTVYELNKLDGSVLESYQGTPREGDDELTIKVISGTKIKIDLGNAHLMATRDGGSAAKSTLSASSTNSLNAATATNIAPAANVMNTKLFKAVSSSDQSQVEEILELGASINATNTQGRTPLEVAVQKSSGDTSMVQFLVDSQAKVSNYALDQAINKNNDELIDVLVNNGGDKNYVALKAIEKGKVSLFNTMIDSHNVTITTQMFDRALSLGKYPLADMMITKRFNPNYALEASIKKDASDLVYAALEAGGNGNSALKYAVKKSDIELATLAIENHSASANTVFKDAIARKKKDMIALLLEKGAKPNSEIEALSAAGEDAILQLLLAKEGDANLGIKAAATANKISTLKLLLKNDADANPIIPIAIKQNNTPMVKLAIDNKAKSDKPEFIKASSTSGNLEITTLLLDAGSEANDGIEDAVIANKPSIVSLLLQRDADGTSANLIQKSTRHNSTQLTGLLLDAGAEPQDGVDLSVRNSAHLVLQQLIDAGADANNQNLLTIAIVNNNLNCSKILINLGLDVNESDSSGLTYLHLAAKNNNSAIAKLLIEKDADVDAVSQGNTPLHLAVRDRKALATVDMLIQAGADVNAKNSKGKTVLKIAKGNKIKKLLKQNGAEKN